MTTSPLSNFQIEDPLPPDPHRQNPPPRNFMIRTLIILIILAGHLVGCASIIAPVEIIAVPELPRLQAKATATPLSLPEPVFTPELIPTPTEVVVIVIDTPTTAPSPTPTAISLIPTPPATLQPETLDIKYVVIITIDGLRPDALFLAYTPTLDSLIDQGAYCPSAQTVKTSETLPSHASMLTGMTEDKHGLLWGLPYIGWPGLNGPTLFSVAHEAGLSTGMIFGKDKMHHLVLPNSVDKLFGADVHDPEIKTRAIEFIEDGLPNVLFIHFPDTDRVGHAHGWMSENQFQSITFVDGLIGEIVAELEREGYLDNTLLIITTDHGGHGFGHGDDSPVDRTIPWLAVGPGVPQGMSIHRTIYTYDTAATVLHAFDLPIPDTWDGRPVMEIFPPRSH